jgi:hypothetical protein
MGRAFTPQGGAGTPFEGQEILSAFSCPPLQANVNDYAVAARGFQNASVLELAATTPVNMTGLAGATANRELTLVNVSADAITLKNANAGSVAVNRFQFGADVVLGSNDSLALIGLAAGGWALVGANPSSGGAPSSATYYTATDETSVLPNSVFLPPTAAPGLIPDLVYWLRADAPLMSAGSFAPALQNSCPWLQGLTPSVVTSSAGATRSATLLNGLGVLSFPGTADGNYEFSGGGPLLHTSTAFVVFNPAAGVTNQDFFCGSLAGSLELSYNVVGGLVLTKSFVAAIGTGTGVPVPGTWFQANATYDDSTGDFAFRFDRAAAGSGSNVQAIVSGSNGVGWDPETASFNLDGMLAELIVYDRVLSAPEIAAVEAYLNAKWGV